MISSVHLLSNSKIAELGSIFELETRAMIRKLYESLSSSSSSAEKDGNVTRAEMKKVLGEITLGITLRMILGCGGENRKYTDLPDRINDFFKMSVEVTIPDVVPFLKWLDYIGGTNQKAFKKAGMEMDRILQACLDDRKTRNHSGFMAEMMVAADKVAPEFSQYDADTITKATCLTMILEGTHTILLPLVSAFSSLLNNRHVIERAQHELDAHVGRHRQVKASDIKHLVYIQAIIKETLRLHPPLPLQHYSPRASRQATARDPRIWDDPLVFRPERFLTSHKEIDVGRKNYFEWVPFGGGRRVCPGIAFALQATVHALAGLLHGFEIETASGEAVADMESTPIDVLLTPRLLPVAYAN
ncbi:hypothetical protein OROGR_009463 [Orobanche gracilis]